MNVLIIGGVAAGTKAAAKLLREDRNLNVTILTKSRDISYAGCGLPYYVGGLIEDRGELIVNTPQSFSRLTGAKVRTGIEVTALDRAAKTVTAKNLDDGSTETLSYDKLVITTGAEPFKPNLPGIDLPGVFCMRTPADAIGLRDQIDQREILPDEPFSPPAAAPIRHIPAANPAGGWRPGKRRIPLPEMPKKIPMASSLEAAGAFPGCKNRILPAVP